MTINAFYFHAISAHFPLALLLVGAIAELTGLLSKRELWQRLGFLLLGFGALSLVCGYFTGMNASGGLVEEGILKRAIERHQDTATLSLCLLLCALAGKVFVVKMNKASVLLRWIVLGLLVLATLSTVRTVYLGQELVFKHAIGVGVDAERNEEEPEEAVAPTGTGDSTDSAGTRE